MSGRGAIRPPIVHLAPVAARSGQRARALFLDRDGVVNVNHGYVHTTEATQWIPGIFELVRKANDAGLLAIVVTNQAGIARGYYSEQEFRAFTRWIHEVFSERGAALAATYYCPHHPEFGDGIECACRKPSPGLLLAAGRDYGLDIGRSLLVGDKPSDIEAARRAGVGKAWLLDEQATVVTVGGGFVRAPGLADVMRELPA